MFTDDALFGGAVRFRQPARGYRANVDSLWLAAFAARGRAAKRVIDLGAGVGVVSLALHHLSPLREVVCVERDLALAELCRENLALSAIAGEVVCSDVARLPRRLAGSFELVVSNPPFFEPGERRPAAPTREPALAGHLAPFLAGARGALGGRGRVALIYPARALTRLLAEARSLGLEPKRLRLVHPFADAPARVALIELKLAKPGGLVIEPPLVEWAARRVPGRELRALSSRSAAPSLRRLELASLAEELSISGQLFSPGRASDRTRSRRRPGR